MHRRNTVPAIMESLDSIPENFTRLRFTSDSVGKIKILYVSFQVLFKFSVAEGILTI